MHLRCEKSTKLKYRCLATFPEVLLPWRPLNNFVNHSSSTDPLHETPRTEPLGIEFTPDVCRPWRTPRTRLRQMQSTQGNTAAISWWRVLHPRKDGSLCFSSAVQPTTYSVWAAKRSIACCWGGAGVFRIDTGSARPTDNSAVHYFSLSIATKVLLAAL